MKKKQEEELLTKYRAHCQDMFLRKQAELKDILFEHFGDRLNADDFDLRYCKDFPKERNADKMMQGDKGKENLAAWMDCQDFEHDLVADSTRAKKMEELRDGGEVAQLIMYREQLVQGFEMVAEEVRKQRRGETKKLAGTAQMEHCVKLLTKHDIDKTAIESVLHFAYDSELFRDGQQEADDEEEEEMLPDLDIIPHWFRGYDDDPKPGDDDGGISKKKKKRFVLKARPSPYKKSSLAPRKTIMIEDVAMGWWQDPTTGRTIALDPVQKNIKRDKWAE